MTSSTPPVYPYPDDEVLWHSASDGFTVGEDSYFALARLPEDDVRVFNGREHRNPYRLVIHTPVRGSFAMYVNLGDLQTLLAIATVGISADDSGMHGDEGEFILFDEWLEIYTGRDVEFVRGDDDEQ